MGWSNKWPSSAEELEQVTKDIEKYPLVSAAKLVKLEIPVKGAWENNSVNAVQVGDLAVHAPIGWDDDYNWRITHVPTLTMFDKAVPVGWYAHTDEQLIQWCWKVQQSNWSYWAQLHEFNNTNYKEIDPKLLNSVREYCLSIEV